MDTMHKTAIIYSEIMLKRLKYHHWPLLSIIMIYQEINNA